MADVIRTADEIYVKGFVKRARRLGVPTMSALPRENESTRREAYELAVSNRHKPWARRYLKSIGRLTW